MGYVYLVELSDVEGVFKIGYTGKHPDARMANLRRTLGPCLLMAYVQIDDDYMARCVEGMVHRRFRNQRYNGHDGDGKTELFHLRDQDMFNFCNLVRHEEFALRDHLDSMAAEMRKEGFSEKEITRLVYEW